ncbi:MAG: ribonuclease P protein component [Chloroflexi bacterium]|nr:ribonuclease P protein component [Chloroflexota bacterium]
MGVPRELRLRRRADFARVVAEGKGRSNALVVLRFAPNRLSTPRCGFSVSKRLGRAVRRNRVKRLLREAARKLMPRTEYDVILIARPEAAQASYAEVEAAVADLLRRAGLLTDPRAQPGAQEPVAARETA